MKRLLALFRKRQPITPACSLDITEPCLKGGNHEFVEGYGGGKSCSKCRNHWPY